jgi:hypothetical protein
MAIELEERRKRADLMHSDLLPPTISAQIYEDYTIAGLHYHYAVCTFNVCVFRRVSRDNTHEY